MLGPVSISCTVDTAVSARALNCAHHYRGVSVGIGMRVEASGSAARMVQVRADFKADLLALGRREFSAVWGSHVQQISDHEILMRYLDSFRRRPAIRPRRYW